MASLFAVPYQTGEEKVLTSENFTVDDGDLLINYGTAVIGGRIEFGSMLPYLFYFQNGIGLNSLEETENQFFGNINSARHGRE